MSPPLPGWDDPASSAGAPQTSTPPAEYNGGRRGSSSGGRDERGRRRSRNDSRGRSRGSGRESRRRSRWVGLWVPARPHYTWMGSGPEIVVAVVTAGGLGRRRGLRALGAQGHGLDRDGGMRGRAAGMMRRSSPKQSTATSVVQGAISEGYHSIRLGPSGRLSRSPAAPLAASNDIWRGGGQ